MYDKIKPPRRWLRPVVDSLFIVAPVVCGFLNHLAEEEKTGCFTLIVSLFSCDC